MRTASFEKLGRVDDVPTSMAFSRRSDLADGRLCYFLAGGVGGFAVDEVFLSWIRSDEFGGGDGLTTGGGIKEN